MEEKPNLWFMRGPGLRCQPSDWHPPRAPTAPAMAGRFCAWLEEAVLHLSSLFVTIPFWGTHSCLSSRDFSGHNLHPSRDAGRVHSSALRKCLGESFEEQLFEEWRSSPEPLDAPQILIKPIYLLNGTMPGCFSTARKPKRHKKGKKGANFPSDEDAVNTAPTFSTPKLQLCQEHPLGCSFAMNHFEPARPHA